MTSKSYLTIDDSPSDNMGTLLDFLEEKNIPALFFCRGDCLEKTPQDAVLAVQKGFVLANHTHSHHRSSEKTFDWIVADIERCERLLENIYKEAGVPQPGKYFRFPHVDRGTGGWIVDFDAFTGDDLDAVKNAFALGLNVKSMEKPDEAAFEKKDRLQEYLKGAGYRQPFKNVTHAWFSDGEIGRAYDCLYTFSNCDWMVTQRHKGAWPYKSIEDLKQKAVDDRWLNMDGSVNVILAHDQSEIIDATIQLINDLNENQMEFLGV